MLINNPHYRFAIFPPMDDITALKIYKAIYAELMKSAATPTKGGLAVSLALGCIGGELGTDVDLSVLGDLDVATLLFTESNSRFVVWGAPEKAAELESLLSSLAIRKVGSVTASKKLIVKDSIDADIDALDTPFKSTLFGV